MIKSYFGFIPFFCALFRCMGCPDSCDLKSPVRCLGNSTVACWDKSGPGGGGSGGTVYLSAKLVNAGKYNIHFL